ncbi:D-alanyl-D-alanine carboxypeptidase family protein [Streptomyces sp. NPDC058953]|uniref:D-alanyl-D-alanine carboxypeptidase family protein n=1 Tax=unclassified Streptomyces TaxID=2593676 RepID=UPI0036C22274
MSDVRRPTRPGPGARPAALPRRRPLLVALAAAGALFAGACAGPADAGLPDADVPAVAAVADSMDLPWPDEGQASVSVEGIGSLGTKGRQTPVPIASVTKVMTVYVILKDHPMKDGRAGASIVADQQAADEAFSSTESAAPVLAGRTYTQRELLEIMMVSSANNVARLLARWDAGGQEAFVAKMNRTAAALGMDRTTYTGVSGIESDTRSTAADQMKLARAAMKDPAFRAIVATPAVTPPGGVRIPNTNKLLGRDGVVGLKTGSSTPAGGNLVWAATQEVAGTPRLVLGVVLGQRAGSTPAQGSAAARDASRALITSVRTGLPAAVTRAAAAGK